MNNLETHVINPATKPIGTVIWMHGLGANNHDFDPLVPSLSNGLPLRFIFPNAPIRPVSINQGVPMPAWYDVFSLSDLNREDAAGVSASQAAITQLVQQEIDSGTPANRIVLAGYSQGGAMALHTGIRLPHKIAGILGLSCYLPLMQDHDQTIQATNLDTPIFITHGTQDMVLPCFLGKMAYDLVARTHKNTQWKQYVMQHEIIQEEVQDINAWLKQCFAQ